MAGQRIAVVLKPLRYTSGVCKRLQSLVPAVSDKAPHHITHGGHMVPRKITEDINEIRGQLDAIKVLLGATHPNVVSIEKKFSKLEEDLKQLP